MKPVRVSAPRRVTLTEHVIGMNLTYGDSENLEGKWAFTISRRTGMLKDMENWEAE